MVTMCVVPVSQIFGLANMCFGVEIVNLYTAICILTAKQQGSIQTIFTRIEPEVRTTRIETRIERNNSYNHGLNCRMILECDFCLHFRRNKLDS